ncbi:MAG: GNAT family N-acetyltransferase [Thermomicrobiales bacterium]
MTPPAPTLRRATLADAQTIAEIHLAARRAAMPWLPEVHTDAETHFWVANVMLPQQEVWVAEVAGAVGGFAALHEGWLEHLYIAPAHQGIGLGSALLDLAMERSPEGLQLYAFQGNTRARQFYEARGFVAEAFGDGADNEEGAPDVRFRWPGRAT